MFKFWETNSNPIFQGMSRLQIIRHSEELFTDSTKLTIGSCQWNDLWAQNVREKKPQKHDPKKKRTKRFSLAMLEGPT